MQAFSGTHPALKLSRHPNTRTSEQEPHHLASESGAEELSQQDLSPIPHRTGTMLMAFSGLPSTIRSVYVRYTSTALFSS